jgi:flavin reductase (DIM6/NTAB) family NADH-FMN oxidoreductase RutF
MTDTNTTTHTQFDALTEAEFKNVVGHFASGVTVVTTAFGDKLYGSTASAFSSLSMDPLSVLVCLNKTSTTNPAVTGSGYFAVNILGEQNAELAKHFSRKNDDKFATVNYSLSQFGGVPTLDDALATIVCEVMDTPVGGTHTVYFGRALEATAASGGPLAYYRGRFGRFEEFEI